MRLLLTIYQIWLALFFRNDMRLILRLNLFLAELFLLKRVETALCVSFHVQCEKLPTLYWILKSSLIE